MSLEQKQQQQSSQLPANLSWGTEIRCPPTPQLPLPPRDKALSTLLRERGNCVTTTCGGVSGVACPHLLDSRAQTGEELDKQKRKGPQGPQQECKGERSPWLTLFPVVVSAPVSAPRRSKTEVLCNPAMESMEKFGSGAPVGLGSPARPPHR